MDTHSNGRISDFVEKTDNPPTLRRNPQQTLVNMGIYLFNTRLLIRVLQASMGHRACSDFGKHILPDLVHSRRCYAYNFTQESRAYSPYWRDVGTLDAYYAAAMDLLGRDSWFQTGQKQWPVYAFHQLMPDAPPRFRYFGDQRKGIAARRSLVFSDSRIQGSVANSVLSPGVVIEPSAHVEDSVLMSGVRVRRGARIRKAIVEEQIEIPPGAQIGGSVVRTGQPFAVSAHGVVVVTQDAFQPRQRSLGLSIA